MFEAIEGISLDTWLGIAGLAISVAGLTLGLTTKKGNLWKAVIVVGAVVAAASTAIAIDSAYQERARLLALESAFVEALGSSVVAYAEIPSLIAGMHPTDAEIGKMLDALEAQGTLKRRPITANSLDYGRPMALWVFFRKR